MAITTYSPASIATKAEAMPRKSGLLSRLVAAMQASRQRQADIEIRRHRALINDNSVEFQDALLPFKGE